MSIGQSTAGKAPAGGGSTVPPFDLPAILRIVGALVWILWGLKLYQPAFIVSFAPELGFLYTIGGVALLILSGMALDERARRWIDVVLLVGALLAFGFWTRVAVFGSPGYGTDEVAFDQGAAMLLLRGVNPYGADLAWTLDAFRVLPSGTTNLLDGGFVHTLSYPAGAFLVYVPLLAAGIEAQTALYVDAAFWIAGMVALWLVLPRAYRGVVPILASLGIYVDYATGGVTDSLMMPFLVLALWRWTRFGDELERSPARWMGPIALGIACTFKQSAWFLVPFLVIGVLIEVSHRPRSTAAFARYLALFAAAFLVPNLPFIIWDPGAWLAGITLPFREPLVPFGQGFVAFVTTFFTGGGSLPAFTVAGGLLLAATMLAFVGWYRSLRPLLPALPLIALLLPTRSLNSYFVYAIPGLLASLSSVSPMRGQLVPPDGLRRASRIGGAGLGVAALAVLAFAVLSRAPLILEPVAYHTTGSLQSVDSLTVVARNTTQHELRPNFAVALGPYMSSYWIIREGPEVLRAGESGQYLLLAPNTPSMPGVDQESVIYALTSEPNTMSAARLFPAVGERTLISPQAINREVTDPPETTLTVQLVDRLNAPLRRAGVSISLGQVLYAAEGLFPGQTSINGRPEGQSPVEAMTDGQGVATFRIRAVQQQPYEVFFQAWITEPFPHGYSAAVAIHFRLDEP
jgi:hypothetical protein